MNKHLLSGIAATTFAASLAFAAPASAAVTFDWDSGIGFVGKGDLQDKFALTNSQIQHKDTKFDFFAVSTTVEEKSWECTNTKNEKIQERAQTITKSIIGVPSSAARVKNQITGYNLTGYGEVLTTTVPKAGDPEPDTCPNGGTKEVWELTTPAGDAVEISSTKSLTVSYNNGEPQPLL